MTIAVTPVQCISQQQAWLIWSDGVVIAACADRLVARRLAALVQVYGLVDMPDTIEGIDW
jgi:hypothetical protein